MGGSESSANHQQNQPNHNQRTQPVSLGNP